MSKEQIFRKKSLEKINSPDTLDQYIKTTNPSIWVLIVAIIIFLVGVILWGIFGTIESKATVGCFESNGSIACSVKESDFDKLNSNSYLLIDDNKYSLVKSEGPTSIQDLSIDSYALHVSNIGDDDWFYVVSFDGKISKHVQATLIFESISPISFVINK